MTQPLHCSIAAPWGFHVALLDNVCPRCGWVPHEPGAAAIDDGNEQEDGSLSDD